MHESSLSDDHCPRTVRYSGRSYRELQFIGLHDEFTIRSLQFRIGAVLIILGTGLALIDIV